MVLPLLMSIDGLGIRIRVELLRDVVDDDMIDDVGNRHVSTNEFRCLRKGVRDDRCLVMDEDW